jgi:hypothetical protein
MVGVSFHQRSVGIMTDSGAHGAFIFTKTGTLSVDF